MSRSEMKRRYKIEMLTSWAEKGDTYAMLSLGHLYAGLHVTRDIEPGVLNELELLDAIFEPEFARDFASAAYWYAKAAELNNNAAQYNLGLLYFYGYGVDQDDHMAFSLFEKAAESGHVYAAYHLARCYLTGRGVEQDGEKAVEYYTYAARNGYKPAFADIGRMYMLGRGVEHNQLKASDYFAKAEKQRAEV